MIIIGVVPYSGLESGLTDFPAKFCCEKWVCTVSTTTPAWCIEPGRSFILGFIKLLQVFGIGLGEVWCCFCDGGVGTVCNTLPTSV